MWTGRLICIFAVRTFKSTRFCSENAVQISTLECWVAMELSGHDTLSRETTLSKLFCPLSEIESSLEKTPSQKGDKTRKETAPFGSTFVPFRVDPFSEGDWCAAKQTWSQKLSSLSERMINLPRGSTFTLILTGSTFGDVWNVVKDPLAQAGKEVLVHAAEFALQQGVTMALDALAAGGKRDIP